MAAVVMFICFALLFVVCLARQYDAPLSTAWRTAFLAASVLWSVYLTATTEVLSAFHQLMSQWVFALWVAFAVALEGLLLWLLRRGHRLWKRFEFARLPISLWLLMGGTIAIAAVTLLIAVAAPPNTADSMTYHLARVMHWIQDASLAPYPSNVISQDIQPPWAEYVLLHLHLLTGSDQLDGTVQWFSFAGSLIAVSLIARQLRSSVRGQIFAAACAATIHMAIIQASSTQNDLVLAYWLLCVVYFLLACATTPSRAAAIGAGAAVGLAALTKGVAYVDAFPFLLVFGVWMFHTHRWHVWRPFAVIAALALLLNLGFFVRNAATFGNPLGPVETTSAFSNASYTPATLVLNAVRNTAVEFATPSLQVNQALDKVVYHALELVHLNPNDPEATMHASPPFLLHGENGLWLSDGYTDNPLDVLLALLAGILCVSIATLRRRRLLMSYLAALIGAFLLFSLYLRWQPGNNRLMLGLFVLAAPFLGCVMESVSATSRRAAWVPASQLVLAVNILLLLTSIPWVFFSQSRPLVGATSVLTMPRSAQYFAVSPPAEQAYASAARYITGIGCKQVGFYASGSQDRSGYQSGAPAWEYPLWVVLDGPGGGDVRIEDVNVTNATAPLTNTPPFASFQPCAIFAILQSSALRAELANGGLTYRRVLTTAAFYQGIVAVYVPEATAHGDGLRTGPLCVYKRDSAPWPAQTLSNRVQ